MKLQTHEWMNTRILLVCFKIHLFEGKNVYIFFLKKEYEKERESGHISGSVFINYSLLFSVFALIWFHGMWTK